MSTTFLFDLFGVLLGADNSAIIHYISKKTENKYEDVSRIFSQLFLELERQVTVGKDAQEKAFHQFFYNLQNSLNNGKLLTVEEFKSTWGKQDISEFQTVIYLPKLRNKYSLNLISNVSNSYLKVLQRKFDFFDEFDNCITSESANYSKPSIQIFQFALNKIGILPKEAIFIDDQKQNVVSAESIGIEGHHYQNFERFKDFISQF